MLSNFPHSILIQTKQSITFPTIQKGENKLSERRAVKCLDKFTDLEKKK